jgi:hypothetical protein
MVFQSALLVLTLSCSGSDSTGPGTEGGTDGGDGKTPGGGAVAFAALSGDQQQGTANNALPQRIVVKLTKGGQPSAGLTINWAVAGGVGSITPATATTDANGESAATWTLGAVTAAQTASASVAGTSMPAVVFHASVPVASMGFAQKNLDLWIGDAATLDAQPKDANGVVLAGAVEMSTSSAQVATLSNGRVTGVSDGVAQIRAQAGASRDSVQVDVYRILHGRVTDMSLAPVAGVVGTATRGTTVDTATFTSDGRYTIRMRSHLTSGNLEILMDPPNRSSSPYYPSLAIMPVDCPVITVSCGGGDMSKDLNFVLLPKEWTVQKGKYANQHLAIDLRKAMEGPNGYGTYFNDAGPEGLFFGGLRAWPTDAYPIKVAIRRTGASEAVTAADSTALWTLLREMEVTLGRSLFTPVPEESGWIMAEPTSAQDGVVQVMVSRPAIPAGHTGAAFLTNFSIADELYDQHHPLLTWLGSKPDTIQLSNSDARAGGVYFATPGTMHVAATVKHEFMHILGVGHGCSWPSIMSYCGKAPPDDDMTLEDVAYWEYLDAARLAERAAAAQFGLYPAFFGERALLDDLEPVPALWLIPLT